MKYSIIDDNIICLECYDEEKYIKDRETDNDYSINDCILVRTTSAFPFNHEIHSPYFDNAYYYGLPFFFEYVISDIIRQKKPDAWEEEMKKYYIYHENLRKTIHFTINGLVQSSIYGNFDSRPYIIIEPLKYHIENPPLSLRAEDTFFKENIELSDECALLIKFDEYEKIKNDSRYVDELKKYKIIVYKGKNEVQALHNSLELLGYDTFMMSNHGYTNSDMNKATGKMTKLLSEIADKNGIPQRRHCYTEEYIEENQNILERNRELDEIFLKYILDNSNISQELKKEIESIIPYYNYNIHADIIKKMIEQIGIEKIAELTRNFNEQMVNETNKTTKRR